MAGEPKWDGTWYFFPRELAVFARLMYRVPFAFGKERGVSWPVFGTPQWKDKA